MSNRQQVSIGNILSGCQPCKLTPKQCLLNFILYFKHDNVTMTHSCEIGWRLLFVMMHYSFCHALMRLDEIQWLIVEETLARRIRNLLGFIRFIDITLVEIFKLWNNVTHRSSLNVRKKIYLVKNTINCWQPRYFHLHQHWIPQVIPWCNYVMAFQSLCQLA
jgi:hypothetical protein